jgi:hypothetical protein
VDQWIRWAYDHAPGFVRAAVDWLVGFVLGVVGVLTNAMHWTGVSWSRLWGAINAAQTTLRGFFGDTFLTLRWLRDVLVPRVVNAAIATLRSWTTAAINTARNLALSAVSTLERWARSAINTTLSMLDSVRRWALDQLNRLGSLLDGLRRALGHVLGGPAVLAGWLAAAMWGALWRYLDSNLDRYVEALWRGKHDLAARFLERAERTLGRIL